MTSGIWLGILVKNTVPVQNNQEARLEEPRWESGLSFWLHLQQVLGFVWMGLNSGYVMTETFHSTVYESLGIQWWITKM